MYRRILIPVSEPSVVEPMIRFGSGLLEPDGEIRLLHIIPTTTLPAVTRQWRDSVNIVVPAHEASAALDVRVDPEVRASTDVVGEILESAETHGVDAIVMTLRGDRRSRNPFVGHTASSILHHSHADVVVVNRLALAEEKIPRILIPWLGSQPEPTALTLAEEISVRHQGVPIISLHLAREAAASADRGPKRSPRGVPIQHRLVFLRGLGLGAGNRLAELVLTAAARERFGLLLVVEESEGGGIQITRRFLEELFRAAPCPVMAVRG